MRSFAFGRRFVPLLGVLIFSLLASHCHPSGDDSSTPAAITNRPQSYDRFIAILKLQAPALLSSAQKVNGKVTVSDDLKVRILAEQEAAIKKLADLSPDIRVLYRYKMVLNGLAIVAPVALEAKFRAMDAVSYVEGDKPWQRLEPAAITAADPGRLARDQDIANHNSATFIGAARVHNELHLTGKGITVGVLDTGIDYTHAMLGGAGTEDAYKANKPAEANSGFPNAKVVGGIDLVGTDYDSESPNFDKHVPVADANPLDEAGHGTHVAGTIAGIGDGIHTYSGVAPDATLYGFKIFGKTGSTGDAVIIEALDLAADPTGNMDPSHRLDVVNLSLGSTFGTPHILFGEAVANLVKADTIMVAAAGNSGDNAYIVGAPSTADDAISVAASIDDMAHNWQFNASTFASSAHPEVVSEAVEATFSKPIADTDGGSGKLVAIGLAKDDLSPEQAAALKGNVALIDRGAVAFFDKVKRAADAGATGAVVVNNVDGDAFVMGGDASLQLQIPAIMISKALGDVLKADMTAGAAATVTFKTDKHIDRPELIDTITSFSSRGPRSIDGALKPEVSAPGYNILSAKMGGGNAGAQMSGTSMATPHMAGVMALLRQAHPDLDVATLKALVMGTAQTMTNPKTKKPYALTAMGAGRVRIYEAATSSLVANPPALSLGETAVETAKVVVKSLTLTNLGATSTTLNLSTDLDAGLSVDLPATVTLAPHETQTLRLRLTLKPSGVDDAAQALGGFINITGGTTPLHIPVLAVINRTGRMTAKELTVHATSAADAAGALTELSLQNAGNTTGEALVFNLLATQHRNEAPRRNPARNNICELESVGWRVATTTVDGVQTEILQIAAKLYNPVTSWQLCELSVLIAGDGSDTPSQELLGTNLSSLSGNEAETGVFASVLTDAATMRRIRHDYETAAAKNPPVYTPAIVDKLDFLDFAHSTLAVVNADLRKVVKTPTGDLRLKISVLGGDTPASDGDAASGGLSGWLTLTPTADGQPYVDLPDRLQLKPGAASVLALTKGQGEGNLVVYFPFNRPNYGQVGQDAQSMILKPVYQP